jgi:C1A family cysteine protease
MNNLLVKTVLLLIYLLFTVNTLSLHNSNNINKPTDNSNDDDIDDDMVETEFKKFKEKFSKSYLDDSEEHKERKIKFKNNLKHIKKRNSQGLSFTLGVGPWADLSNEEFRKTILMDETVRELRKQERESDAFLQISSNVVETSQLKTSYNWSSYFQSARNQSSCGSCWAFATAGAIEGNFAKNYNYKTYFSTQELVDCDTYASGCSGGYFEYTYAKNKGLVLESDYTYKGSKGTCSVSSNKSVYLSSTSTCSSCSISSWLTLLAQGPVSVAMDAGSSDFQNYSSGILNTSDLSCSTDNHEVVAVGYDSDSSSTPIITVRNCWSTSWGESGYFRIYYASSGNTCYITKWANLPVPVLYNKCVILYGDVYYSGTSYLRCWDDDNSNFKDWGFGDTASSIKVGSNTQVILYSNYRCTGSSYTLTADNNDFRNISMNDVVSSIAIFSTAESIPANCVWIYEHCCYGGSKIELCSNTADFRSSSVNFNDEASAIRFGSNVSAITLWANIDYSGATYTLTSDYACFKNSGDSYNDVASSITFSYKS